MQCEVEGCNREAKTHKYGHLCLLHYKRYVRYGGTSINKTDEKHEQKLIRESSKCKYCDRLVGRTGAFGMCNKHYQMYRKHGDAMYFDRKERSLSHGYYRFGKRGQALHRKIYENYIGRKLKPSEVVHHINFIKTDNRIENLYLYSSKSEHTRQHQKYRKLLKELGSPENIRFKDGIYYKSC